MAALGPITPKPSSRTYASVVISTEATGESDSINITGLTLSSIETSTEWTAAAIGFKASIGTTNLYQVCDIYGDALAYKTTAKRILAFDPAVFSGIQKLQLVSMTTAGVVVQQTSPRTFYLGLSEYVTAD